MKRIQKITALLLVIVMLFSLTGCAGKGKGVLNEKDDKAKLYEILDEILENVRPGTAGSRLAAIRSAAKLVSWAAASNMSKKEAAEAVTEWVKELPRETRAEFAEHAKSVAEAYGKLASDGAKELLQDAGVKSKLAEITGQMGDLIGTILETLSKN